MSRTILLSQPRNQHSSISERDWGLFCESSAFSPAKKNRFLSFKICLAENEKCLILSVYEVYFLFSCQFIKRLWHGMEDRGVLPPTPCPFPLGCPVHHGSTHIFCEHVFLCQALTTVCRISGQPLNPDYSSIKVCHNIQDSNTLWQIVC